MGALHLLQCKERHASTELDLYTATGWERTCDWHLLDVT